MTDHMTLHAKLCAVLGLDFDAPLNTEAHVAELVRDYIRNGVITGEALRRCAVQTHALAEALQRAMPEPGSMLADFKTIAAVVDHLGHVTRHIHGFRRELPNWPDVAAGTSTRLKLMLDGLGTYFLRDGEGGTRAANAGVEHWVITKTADGGEERKRVSATDGMAWGAGLFRERARNIIMPSGRTMATDDAVVLDLLAREWKRRPTYTAIEYVGISGETQLTVTHASKSKEFAVSEAGLIRLAIAAGMPAHQIDMLPVPLDSDAVTQLSRIISADRLAVEAIRAGMAMSPTASSADVVSVVLTGATANVDLDTTGMSATVDTPSLADTLRKMLPSDLIEAADAAGFAVQSVAPDTFEIEGPGFAPLRLEGWGAKNFLRGVVAANRAAAALRGKLCVALGLDHHDPLTTTDVIVERVRRNIHTDESLCRAAMMAAEMIKAVENALPGVRSILAEPTRQFVPPHVFGGVSPVATRGASGHTMPAQTEDSQPRIRLAPERVTYPVRVDMPVFTPAGFGRVLSLRDALGNVVPAGSAEVSSVVVNVEGIEHFADETAVGLTPVHTRLSANPAGFKPCDVIPAPSPEEEVGLWLDDGQVIMVFVAARRSSASTGHTVLFQRRDPQFCGRSVAGTDDAATTVNYSTMVEELPLYVFLTARARYQLLADIARKLPAFTPFSPTRVTVDPPSR